MKLRNLLLLNLTIFFQSAYSQEGIAVYTDYLTDNYYLIHPSMAGASNCAKLRVTGRQQWFGQQEAPSLQTMSFNTTLDEDGKSGVGMIAFNDRNGYHSQSGAKLTYAHHLLFSRTKADLNMLSFGLSTAFIQSRLDETAFKVFDPQICFHLLRSSRIHHLLQRASHLLILLRKNLSQSLSFWQCLRPKQILA